MMQMISYIPILTTILSGVFLYILIQHLRQKSKATYLLWWTLGVFCYGGGTLLESWVSVVGWSPLAFKLWYVFGALLGGAPLAQGTVHLLLRERVANRLSMILVAVIAVSSVLVFLSPLQTELAEAHRLTGAVLGWQWVRLITPFINLYAFVFLVGGAMYSAWIYARQGTHRARMLGNVFIAIGGLLPGIGGSFTKFGYTEVLYVTELIGLIAIFYGYWVIRQAGSQSVHQAQVIAQQA
jgi:hypothetical protein